MGNAKFFHMTKNKFFNLLLALFFLILPLKASDDALLDYAKNDKPIRLISFDGGGMRGLFSLLIAEAVENALPDNKKLFDYVDFFAGASTGGMIATGLADGHPIHEGIDLYLNNGLKIFPKLGFGSTVKNFTGPAYSHVPLDDQLKTLFGEDKKFNDIQKGVIIPTIDIEGINGKIGHVIFNSKTPCSMKAWEVCRATASAPTYFEPFYGTEGGSYIDGGIIDNRSIMSSTSAILSLYKPSVRHKVMKKMRIISIGTGMVFDSIDRNVSRKMGLAGWAKELSTITIRDAMGKESEIARTIYGDRYIELNTILPHKVELHAADPDSLKTLKDAASAFISSAAGAAQIKKAVDLLTS